DKDDYDEAKELTRTSVTNESEDEPMTDEPENEYAVVDVKGEVTKPGVYDVPIDSRVHNVVELAGGFTPDADQSAVNLAQKIHDEMVIFIPKTGEDNPPGVN